MSFIHLEEISLNTFKNPIGCRGPKNYKQFVLNSFLWGILGIRCLVAPLSAENEANYITYETGTPVEIDASLDYKCRDGRKLASDYAMDTLVSTCREDNTWEDPVWQKCVSS